MAQEQVEEYLETIYDLENRDGSAKTTAIAKCLKVAPASVTEVLRSLSDKGLVRYEPYQGATLTNEGKKIADTIKRRHRLLEVFLTDVLKLNREKVHDEACKMEHTISEDTENALCRMLECPRPLSAWQSDRPLQQRCGELCRVRWRQGKTDMPVAVRDKKIIPITDLDTGPERKDRIHPGRLQGCPAPLRSRAYARDNGFHPEKNAHGRAGGGFGKEDKTCGRSRDRRKYIYRIAFAGEPMSGCGGMQGACSGRKHGIKNAEYTIALAGNANVGKSVTFNQLTGVDQIIGNWPGKTVERAEGLLLHKGHRIRVIDLPGIYSFSTYSMEELVSRDFIALEHPDAVVNVIDASALERNLFFTIQSMELAPPLLIAVNQIDLAEKKGITIDTQKLSALLGVPVVPTIAIRGKGIPALTDAIPDLMQNHPVPPALLYGKEIEERYRENHLTAGNVSTPYPVRWTAIKLLERDPAIVTAGQRTGPGRC